LPYCGRSGIWSAFSPSLPKLANLDPCLRLWQERDLVSFLSQLSNFAYGRGMMLARPQQIIPANPTAQVPIRNQSSIHQQSIINQSAINQQIIPANPTARKPIS